MEERPESPKPRRLIRGEATIESSFTGPLPPAETYAQYENAYPGTAGRILDMADAEQKHRIDWENKSLEYAAKAERRGQWMAFSLALGCIAGAVHLWNLSADNPGNSLGCRVCFWHCGEIFGQESEVKGQIRALVFILANQVFISEPFPFHAAHQSAHLVNRIGWALVVSADKLINVPSKMLVAHLTRSLPGACF